MLVYSNKCEVAKTRWPLPVGGVRHRVRGVRHRIHHRVTPRQVLPTMQFDTHPQPCGRGFSVCLQELVGRWCHTRYPYHPVLTPIGELTVQNRERIGLTWVLTFWCRHPLSFPEQSIGTTSLAEIIHSIINTSSGAARITPCVVVELG